MKKATLWLWQLPQHLLALVIWLVLWLTGQIVRRECDGAGRALITVCVPGWGVSLGRYIFMDEGYDGEDWKHEFGHSVQSRAWGPLYLLAVGLPSALGNNLWDRLFHKSWPVEKRAKWYYSRYPEKQADMLGGVERAVERI